MAYTRAPDDVLILGLHGLVCLLQGDFDLAEADYYRLAVLAPKTASSVLFQGWVCLLKGQYDLALEYYDRAQAEEPQNARAIVGVALVHLMSGHADLAIRDLDRAFALLPGTVDADASTAYTQFPQLQAVQGSREAFTTLLLNLSGAEVMAVRGLAHLWTGDRSGHWPTWTKRSWKGTRTPPGWHGAEKHI